MKFIEKRIEKMNRTIWVVTLVFFGVLIGTYSAWQTQTQSNQSSVNALAGIEPAAGESGDVESGDKVAGVQIGGAFSLTDHFGKDVTNESYSGQYKLIFFGFTHCPDICPAGLARMANALEIMSDKGDVIQPLFITVDPLRDTPEVMEVYLGQYHDRLVGLTGTDDQLRDVMNTYKVYAAKVEDPQGIHEYTMDHSAFMFLMGPDDAFLGLYGSDDSPAEIAEDVLKNLS
jgi:protein SCO1/2